MNQPEPSLTLTFSAEELGELAALLLFISKQLDLMPESEEREFIQQYAERLTNKLKQACDEEVAREKESEHGKACL